MTVTAQLHIGAGMNFLPSSHRRFTRDSHSIATERASFTFFEARSINFAIVVYSYIHARRCSTCIEPTVWDHGGQHGQESEEGEGKEDRQEEKEVGLADLLRQIKVRAVCLSRADVAAA
jgi:hypothetical protein